MHLSAFLNEFLSFARKTPGEVVLMKSCVCPNPAPLCELTVLLTCLSVYCAYAYWVPTQCQVWCWGLGDSGEQNVRDLFLESVHLNSSLEKEKIKNSNRSAFHPCTASQRRQCGPGVKDTSWWPWHWNASSTPCKSWNCTDFHLPCLPCTVMEMEHAPSCLWAFVCAVPFHLREPAHLLRPGLDVSSCLLSLLRLLPLPWTTWRFILQWFVCTSVSPLDWRLPEDWIPVWFTF